MQQPSFQNRFRKFKCDHLDSVTLIIAYQNERHYMRKNKPNPFQKLNTLTPNNFYLFITLNRKCYKRFKFDMNFIIRYYIPIY